MHGFLLMRRGETIAEGYWKPFTASMPHRMYSISKSMTSLAVGMLLDRGRISLDDRIVSHFPDMLPPVVPERLKKLTIHDMLRMATCYRKTTYRSDLDSDWARIFFHAEPDHEPGTVFSYDSSASQVLALLAERMTGMPLIEFLQRNVFDKIGAADAKRWLTDPSGASQGGSGLCMTLRDLAKVSALILRGGDGILPADYLKAATARQIETVLQANPEERFGYGYQFWRTRNGYSMYGMGGQLAVFVPEKSVLLCTTADTRMDQAGVQKIYDAFFDILLPGIGDEPPDARPCAADLEERLLRLACPAVRNIREYSCKTADEYRMLPNAMNLRAVRLREGALELDKPNGSFRLELGFGEQAMGLFPDSAEPCMTSAGWIAPGVLRIRSYLIGDSPCGIDMLLAFRGNAVTVKGSRSQDPLTRDFDGTASGYAPHAAAGMKASSYRVSKDGSGDFASIQAAVDAIPGNGSENIRLLVSAGEYRERVIISRDNVHITGDSPETTSLVFSNHATQSLPDGSERGTFLTATLLVAGNNATIENMTIRNDAGDGRAVGQALAVYAAGDREVFRNCRLAAHQDTLFCGPTMPNVAKDALPYIVPQGVLGLADALPFQCRQYYENCFIQGDVDFIFGPYRCWFENCALMCNARGGWYTAANTPEGAPFGFVFHHCHLRGECAPGAAYLGRPWREHAAALFLDCEMDACVSPQGFSDWKEPFRPVTARCGEHGTRGARADISERHKNQKILSPEEAAKVTLENVMASGDGDPWMPNIPGH